MLVSFFWVWAAMGLTKWNRRRHSKLTKMQWQCNLFYICFHYWTCSCASDSNDASTANSRVRSVQSKPAIGKELPATEEHISQPSRPASGSTDCEMIPLSCNNTNCNAYHIRLLNEAEIKHTTLFKKLRLNIFLFYTKSANVHIKFKISIILFITSSIVSNNNESI